MPKSKIKESVSKLLPVMPDAPDKDGESTTQAAVETLVQTIIDAGESVRRS